jgi:hypothetical protein
MATTVYYGANTTWNEWNYTATGTSSTQIVWQVWSDNTTATPVSFDPWPCWTTTGNSVQIEMPPMSEEERAAAEARRAASEARYVEQRKQAEEARDAAERLLVSCLNRRQRSEYRRDKCFTVITRNGRRRYRIRPGEAPIRIHGEDGRRYRYCIHPAHGFPSQDVALSQKLLLESDEAAFLRIANESLVVA